MQDQTLICNWLCPISVTGCVPSYLLDLCRPVSDLASLRALRSWARGELLVPWARSALKQRGAFSVIGLE